MRRRFTSVAPPVVVSTARSGSIVLRSDDHRRVCHGVEQQRRGHPNSSISVQRSAMALPACSLAKKSKAQLASRLQSRSSAAIRSVARPWFLVADSPKHRQPPEFVAEPSRLGGGPAVAVQRSRVSNVVIAFFANPPSRLITAWLAIGGNKKAAPLRGAALNLQVLRDAVKRPAACSRPSCRCADRAGSQIPPSGLRRGGGCRRAPAR
jgi:hypothetical protein